ncbi:hypothetical protein L6452_26350 [Arctium lappa]|uniref:Uncharacterized protein n=1 Tax=Arctium lappa TaxID=4217 RepID=A0ACB9ACI6_ARCLA|nr:hypothetical protein L6452_26350 [Arctium lappa]
MSRSNEEWLQFYQPATIQSWSGDADHATVVTPTNTGVSNQLSRVARPTNTNNRRRSRASRKTPTTLLNTDTTNFRAMVQQFTGGGNAGAAPLPSHDSSVTATHQSLNTYSTTSFNINDGVASTSSVGGLLPHDGRNMQFRQPQSRQPHFRTTVDDGGSSTGYDGYDQNLGYGQRGSYTW